MIASFGLGLLGMTFCQAIAPPDLSGAWTGEAWGQIVLEATQAGAYEGAFGERGGSLQLKWSETERRFNGAWREGDGRGGLLSVRIVDGEVRGAWTTSRETGVDRETPRLGDLRWVRSDPLDGNVALSSRGATIDGPASHPQTLLDGVVTGYHGTRGWARSLTPATWIVTLPREYPLRQIRLLLYDRDSRAFRYTIETSADGKKYELVADRSRQWSRSWQAATCPGRPVRHIRVRCLDSTYNDRPRESGFFAVELEAYCRPPKPQILTPNLPNPYLNPNPNPNPSPSSSPAPSPSSSFSPSVSVPPSFSFSLAASSEEPRPHRSGHITLKAPQLLVTQATPTPPNETPLATLPGHENHVNSTVFSPDGKTLAAGDAAGMVFLWDISTRKKLRSLNSTQVIECVAFSPDGKTLVTADRGWALTFWDVATGRETKRVKEHSSAVMSVAYSPEGDMLASAGVDNAVRIWDASSGEVRMTMKGHMNAIQEVAFSRDGRKIASVDLDGVLRIWDPISGKTLSVYQIDRSGMGLTFSPDGKTIATANYPPKVQLLDVASGKVLGTLMGHRSRVRDVAFSPDGRLLASAGDDQTIRIWDTASQRQVGLLSGHAGRVHDIEFSPDGRTLVSGSSDATSRVWSVERYFKARP